LRQAQSYIVRVYVRGRDDGLGGTVEIVRTGERRGFTSPEELLRIVLRGRRVIGASRTRLHRDSSSRG